MNKASEADGLLTPAQELFAEGKKIGARLDKDLQSAVDRFYQKAIPFGHKVKKARPWRSREFATLNDPDSDTAFLNFLKESFSDRQDKTARQQAAVVRMCVNDGYDVADIEGIPLRYLLKLAGVVRFVGKEERRKLMEATRTCKNIRDFEARVETVKRGYHVEPNVTRYMSGSQSADKMIDTFDKVTTKMGDARPVMEKIADTVGSMLYTNDNPLYADSPGVQMWSNRVLAGYCRFMRRQEPAFDTLSDSEILSKIVFGAWLMRREEFDDETEKEFTELERSRPKGI